MSTFDGARRIQLRRGLVMSLRQRLEALDRLTELSERLQRMPKTYQGTTVDIQITALGGALIRHTDGWRWSDGSTEPRVRDMSLADISPSFRCITTGSGTYVEIPHDWTDSRYWPRGHVDEDSRVAIQGLIRDGSAKPGPIYAEGLSEALDSHRLAKHGYLLPISVWDTVMGEVCGAWWDKDEEADILARAEALRNLPE